MTNQTLSDLRAGYNPFLFVFVSKQRILDSVGLLSEPFEKYQWVRVVVLEDMGKERGSMDMLYNDGTVFRLSTL